MSPEEWRFLTLLNQRASDLCQNTIEQHQQLDVQVSVIGGANVLDFGVDRAGTIDGGIRLAEICLANLASVEIQPAFDRSCDLPTIVTRTDFPMQACIASQYAGWPLSDEDYFAMASGPARQLRGREEILTEYHLQTRSEQAVVVLESNQRPPESVIKQIARDCGLSPDRITICIAKTASFPGSIQVVARSVETTLHKLHELGFNIANVRSGFGSAPLPPIAKEDLTALGWTNDAILYGGVVNLWVQCGDEQINAVMQRLPSSSSSDFGEPFLTIFDRYDRDFYKIDKLLFSPAKVIINNLSTGQTFSVGDIRSDILKKSFGVV
jgi:methenyltetrahydromethanopterin cyclohydrolase